MKKLIVSLVTLLPIITESWGADSLAITDALIREAPPGMMMTAGYAEWRNNSSEEIIVNGASSEGFNAVEIHLSSIENGIARMTAQDSLTIPPNGSVILEPGGLHLMLMGAKEPIKAGDSIEITLHTSIGDRTARFVIKRF